MVSKYDPEFLKAIEPMLPAMSQMQKPALHDVEARRASVNATFLPLLQAFPEFPDVEVNVYHTKAKDGFNLPIYHFRKKGTPTQGSLPAVVHNHGGGYISLSVEIHYVKMISAIVSATGVQMFSTDYRLAPEHQFPTPVEDCYTGLLWVRDHATDFNIDLARIAVYGDSAGGGLAAALAIMARDRQLSPPLVKQILIYPMLDDRTGPPSSDEAAFTWSTEDSITAWTAYVGQNAGKDGVSPYAAAARVENVEGLPSTYIDVGTLDRFKDEDIHYAMRLAAANVELELHVYPGVPHAFEVLARGTGISNQAFANRFKALKSF